MLSVYLTVWSKTRIFPKTAFPCTPKREAGQEGQPCWYAREQEIITPLAVHDPRPLPGCPATGRSAKQPRPIAVIVNSGGIMPRSA